MIMFYDSDSRLDMGLIGGRWSFLSQDWLLGDNLLSLSLPKKTAQAEVGPGGFCM